MYAKHIIAILLFLAFGNSPVPAVAGDLAKLEKEVVARAESEPESAPGYFMQQIELRPAPNIEVQAVYLYGMGLAYERLENMTEALDHYRGAELFGHQGAAAALTRLNRKPFPRPNYD